MRQTWHKVIILLTVISVTVAACGEVTTTVVETEAAPILPVDFGVIAEGQLAPRRHVEIAFSTSGRVIEVAVTEGDKIVADQLLARLENEPQLQASAQQARSKVQQSEATAAQAKSSVEQARSDLEQARSGVEQAMSNIQLAEYNLLQTALELPQINYELKQAELQALLARQTLDKLYENSDGNIASIQSEIARSQAALEDAQLRLDQIDQPDIAYYENKIIDEENLLLQWGREAQIIKIGPLTDAVDRARDFLNDESEFLDKVEKSDAGCKIDVDAGDHTKLVFNEELTYRSETYNTSQVYNVPDWIAEELLADFSSIVSKATITCDPQREHAIDGRTATLKDAKDNYNDAVTGLEEAERQLELGQLKNQQSIRDTENSLARAKRNLAWATSGKYSKMAIKAAEQQSATDLTQPQSIDAATALANAEIASAVADLSDAQDLYKDLQDGLDPDDLEIALAQIEQADARIALAEALKDQVQPRIRQSEAALNAAEAAASATSPALDAAEARVAASEANLLAAEAGLVAAQSEVERANAELEKNELRAPWDGTVADLNLKEDEYVAPGQTVLAIADFDGWVVETDNLTEIEVPEVSVGQRVKIVPDALPELTLSGKVVSIASLYDEKRGDVTYTVTLDLTESDPRLRWGMTVVVKFPPPN